MVDSYERFRSGTFAHLIWKLEKEQFISAEDLAETLVQDRGKVIPDKVLDYLVRMLRDEISKPSGRPRKSDFAQLREIYAISCYEKYLAWLQKRQAGLGLKGWGCIRKAEWWQGAPNERAARMAACRFRGGKWNIGHRHIQNLVSSFKRS